MKDLPNDNTTFSPDEARPDAKSRRDFSNGASKKKIIYFITKSVWGGAAKYIIDLAGGLDKERFDVYIAAGGSGPLKEKSQKTGAVYLAIPHFERKIKFLGDLLGFFEVLYIIGKIKPDIVHVNSSKAGGVCGLAGSLYKITGQKLLMIFTAHGWAFNESRPGWQISLIKFLSRLTTIFYQKIICISSLDIRTAKELKIAPERKLVLIHNGIDADYEFLGKKEAKIKLLGKEYPLVMGTVGEWIRNKGWDILIKAAPPLFDKFPNLTLVLIAGGESPEREKINNERIKVIENLPEAEKYLRAFDVFVFPSRKEGLPYALLEASLAELPIIASAAGGNLDIVEDGKTGFLIPPENPNELKKAIEKLLNNRELAKNMGEIAKEKIKKEFTIKEMRKKTYELYSL